VQFVIQVPREHRAQFVGLPHSFRETEKRGSCSFLVFVSFSSLLCCSFSCSAVAAAVAAAETHASLHFLYNPLLSLTVSFLCIIGSVRTGTYRRRQDVIGMLLMLLPFANFDGCRSANVQHSYGSKGSSHRLCDDCLMRAGLIIAKAIFATVYLIFRALQGQLLEVSIAFSQHTLCCAASLAA